MGEKFFDLSEEGGPSHEEQAEAQTAQERQAEEIRMKQLDERNMAKITKKVESDKVLELEEVKGTMIEDSTLLPPKKVAPPPRPIMKAPEHKWDQPSI
jgi:hypothetical protein